jgi:poly(3-hydroxybutyrate) depolymerase
MFSIHCFGCDLSTMEYMSAIANEYNFVWVNPEGLRRSFNADACCGYAMEQNVNDVEFFAQIIQHLAEDFPTFVSPDWVYAMGWSNGGYMVSYAAHLFRGIAPVSGYEIETLSVERPTAIFLNHATDDHMVQPTGCCTDPTMPKCCCQLSDFRYDQCTSIEEQAVKWAKTNGCKEPLVARTMDHPSLNVKCHLYEDCRANTTLCLHGGHKGHFNGGMGGFETMFPWSHEIVDFFATHMCQEQGGNSDETGPTRWDPLAKVCHCPVSPSKEQPNQDYFSGPYCTRTTGRSSEPVSSSHDNDHTNHQGQSPPMLSSPEEPGDYRWIMMLSTLGVLGLVLGGGLWTRQARRPSKLSPAYARLPQSALTKTVEMSRLR